MYARPIKYKVNGPGTEQTADGFVATPVRYSTISVEDLADHISADSRVERSKVAVITDSLIKQIREMVLNGHKIVVPHLGSFKPKIKSQLAINPENVDATSFSAKVRFTPSVELKRDLQASRIEKTTLPVAPEAPSIEQQKTALLADFTKKVTKAYQDKYGKDKVTVRKAASFGIGGNPEGENSVVVAMQFTVQGEDFLCSAHANIKAPKGYFDEGGDIVSGVVPFTTGWQRNEDDGEINYGLSPYKVSEPFALSQNP